MKKKRQAFTLIELIIVIAILGILAAIAIPKYRASKREAAITAHKANVKMLNSAAEMKILEEGDEDFIWSDKADYHKYLDAWPRVPDELDKNKPYTLTYDSKSRSITVEPSENAYDSQSQNSTETD